MRGLEAFGSGDWLRNYQIAERLGAGGMATVYLGNRRGAAGFSVPVVIKVIHQHLSAEDQFVRMFIDEARISSMVRHPNVVRVEEFGEHDGRYYLVMEYVDGCSLSGLSRANRQHNRTLAPDVASALVVCAADGLHAAHQTVDDAGELLGLVHRDVSPSNILIGKSGSVKLIDFGIAKARGRVGDTKSHLSLKGKLRYMSPEQALGHAIDQRSDIYSLAIVFWELLTGRVLFPADNEFALLSQVREPVIPPPSSIVPLPSSLDPVIAKATAKQLDDRYQSAAEFRRAITNAMPSALLVDRERLAELVTLPGVSTFPASVGSDPIGGLFTPSDASIAIEEPPTKATPPPSLERPSAPRSRRVLALLAFLAVAAIVVVGAFLYRGEQPSRSTAVDDGPASERDVESPGMTSKVAADAATLVHPRLDAGVDAGATPVAATEPQPLSKASKKRALERRRARARKSSASDADSGKPVEAGKSDDDLDISTDFDKAGNR